MDSAKTGKLELVVGPMYAGKTTELGRLLRRRYHSDHAAGRGDIVIVKHKRDVRYDSIAATTNASIAETSIPGTPTGDTVEEIVTHDRVSLAASLRSIGGAAQSDSKKHKVNVRVVVAEHIADVELQDSETIVGVEEGHFFDDCHRVDAWAATRYVVVSALNGDFMRRPFPSVVPLYSLCDTIIHLSAVCDECKNNDAPFTSRTSNETAQIVVGADDKYLATCRGCAAKFCKPSTV